MAIYEVMFLVDPNLGENWTECETRIRHVLERSGASVLRVKKWDERRLAFEVKGRKRGVYVLAYFTDKGEAPAKIERDVRLSEDLLRVLILRADYVNEAIMNADTPLTAPKPKEDEYENYGISAGGYGGRSERHSRPRREAPAASAVEAPVSTGV